MMWCIRNLQEKILKCSFLYRKLVNYTNPSTLHIHEESCAESIYRIIITKQSRNSCAEGKRKSSAIKYERSDIELRWSSHHARKMNGYRLGARLLRLSPFFLHLLPGAGNNMFVEMVPSGEFYLAFGFGADIRFLEVCNEWIVLIC